MTRILLIDDHAVVREGYRRLLECAADCVVVAEASNAAQAYRRYLEHAPDVVITDLSLPGVSGIELLRRLRRREPRLRALAFSVHEEAIFVERSLAAGATGYISKRCAPDVLIDAVAAVARGERYVSTGSRKASAALDRPLLANLEQLSHREFEIFRLIAEGKPVRSIGTSLSISGKTVSNHCSQIRSKLGLQSSADMAKLAIAMGIVHA